MINIYVARNKKVGAYENPFFDVQDKHSLMFNLQKFVILQPEKAKAQFMDECEMYFLGTFDQESCQFDLLEKPEYLIDLGDVYARRVREDDKA
ncbi:VP5 [Gokushovirus WZ-2015a]|nr:VP5 [Gokushovirus WZ-2015a]